MDVLVTQSHGSDLLLYLYGLYQNSSLCDVTIQCQDGVEFDVHRIVLSASSRFLKQMFTTNPSLISVKLDLTSTTMQPLLEYSYTGQLFLPHQLQRGITDAASFLQMYSVLDLIKKQVDGWADSGTQILSSLGDFNLDSAIDGDGTVDDHVHTRGISKSAIKKSDKVPRSSESNSSMHILQDVSNEKENIDGDREDEDQHMYIDLGETQPGIQCDSNMVKHDDQHTASGVGDVVAVDECLTNLNEDVDDGFCQRNQSLKAVESQQSGRSSRKKMEKSPMKDKNSAQPQVGCKTQQTKMAARKSSRSRLRMKKEKSNRNNKRDRKNNKTLKIIPRKVDSALIEVDEKGNERKDGQMGTFEQKTSQKNSRSKCSEKTAFVTAWTPDGGSKCKTYTPENRSVSCELCGEQLNSFHKLYIHKRSSHRHLFVSALMSKYLVQNYKLFRDFKRYTLAPYNQLFSYKCNICGCHFPTCSLFIVHCRKIHKHMPFKHIRKGLLQYFKFRFNPKTIKSIQLKDNDKIYTSLKGRKCLNLSPVFDFSKFDCELCGRMFLSSFALSTHKRRVHMLENSVDVKIQPEEEQYENGRMETQGKNLNQKAKVAKTVDVKKESEANLTKAGLNRSKKCGKVRAASRKSIAKSWQSFCCPVCRRWMMTQTTLFKHLQTIHLYSAEEARIRQFDLPDPVSCEVTACQFISSNLNQLSDHMRQCHPFIQYQCTYCEEIFQMELLLRRHLVAKHNAHRKLQRYSCGHCDKMFTKHNNVLRHEVCKHGIQHSNIKVHHCKQEGCTYRSLNISSLRSHQSKHSKEKLFKCDFCHLYLKTELCRRKHMNKMHLGIRPYLCQVCGQNFGEEHELKAHISYKHSTEREFQCPYCVYSTAVKSTFHTHLYNIHKQRAEDDKRIEYQCPHCPFKSLLHHRFQIHMNGHTNTRQYQCSICSKSFISSSTLKAHKQWIHSDNIHSCTQCEYQTKTLQKLNEHIRVQHQLKGFKPYRCPYCDFQCATGGNTRKHVKQVHPGKEVTYIRDDDLLAAARIARASGHHAQLTNLVPGSIAGTEDGCDRLEGSVALKIVE